MHSPPNISCLDTAARLFLVVNVILRHNTSPDLVVEEEVWVNDDTSHEDTDNVEIQEAEEQTKRVDDQTDQDLACYEVHGPMNDDADQDEVNNMEDGKVDCGDGIHVGFDSIIFVVHSGNDVETDKIDYHIDGKDDVKDDDCSSYIAAHSTENVSLFFRNSRDFLSLDGWYGSVILAHF